MPTAPSISTPARRLTAVDLAAGPDLAPTADGWEATAAQVRFSAATPLPAGWYQVRLAVRSDSRFTVHKRCELVFDPADANPRPPARETFTWNRQFDEKLILKLSRPARGLRIDLHRAEGPFSVEKFDVSWVPDRAAMAIALREKFRLIRAYRCAGRVMWRGGKMLLSGRFAAFRAKVMKGLVDSRAMRFGSRRSDEVDAAWWRRHALSNEEAERVAEACDAMADPPPLAVLLPVDPCRLDQARLAAHSVRRQIYPHWELLIAAAGPAGLTPHLNGLIDPDPRVKIIRVPGFAGLPTAVAKAVGGSECDHVVVLPPGVDLGEHALYHFAAAVKAAPDTDTFGAKVYDVWEAIAGPGRDKPDQLRQQAHEDDEPDEVEEAEEAEAKDKEKKDECPIPPSVWMTRTKRLAGSVPRRLAPKKVSEWVARDVATGDDRVLEPVLAFPIDDRPLLDRARVGRKPTPKTRPLYLAAHLVGITGYDHLVFAVLKGLPSVGVELRVHPTSGIRADLVPPALMPKAGGWEHGKLELQICPPWLAQGLDAKSNAAVITMWECDRINPEWAERLNAAKVVIVPSRWSVDGFRASGVTAPMAVAPLGFDPLVFHPGVTPPPEVCTFGTAGMLAAGGLRKNTQKLIDLFRVAFPTEQDVRLRVKITPNSPAVETYDDPRVDVIRAVLPHGKLADWYRSLTAYVNASAGEGFGLHLIEAMACGRPLVTPCYSGLTAFFDPSIGYAIDYRLVPVDNDVYRGTWAEPVEESIVARLRQVYADKTEAARLGELSAARATGFTWKAAGKALAAALREHGFVD